MYTSRHYKTFLSFPKSDLFKVNSIDFGGPFSQTAMSNKYLLVYDSHLTEWPIVVAAERATGKIVVDFLREEIVMQFGLLRLLVSANSTCFMASAVQNDVETLGTR